VPDDADDDALGGGLAAFGKIASEALNWPAKDDQFELLPLSSVLEQVQNLYLEDVERFDKIADRVEKEERFIGDITVQLETFSSRISEEAGLPKEAKATIFCVPLEPAIFQGKTYASAYRDFCVTHQQFHRFNEKRGDSMLDFMLAHFMEETPHFERLNRGLRSKVLSYASGIESIYSMWEGNTFGRIYTLPGADLPKAVHVSAMHRLVDAIFSAGGFATIYAFFRKKLNPLEKFPLKLLYNIVMKDSKTLLQEFTQEFSRRLPLYDVEQVGGEAHNPVFRCAVCFDRYEFEARSGSKSAAEVEAASKALEFLLQHDNRRIALFIAKKLSSGMRRSRGPVVVHRKAVKMMDQLRTAVRASCPDQALLKCLTLRADASRYMLEDEATSESFSLCGSQLALIFDVEKYTSAKETYPTFNPQIVAMVRSTRERIYPRTKDRLSTKAYYDVIQALLYAEFLHGGFSAARDLFCRVSRPRSSNGILMGFEHFSPGVNYPLILQEFTQRDGGQRPVYEYLSVDPLRAHAPIYQCRASFKGVFGEGMASTKRQARHKAAHVLMAKLLKAQGDA
jgi:dsRNA-specific ribonuclease